MTVEIMKHEGGVEIDMPLSVAVLGAVGVGAVLGAAGRYIVVPVFRGVRKGAAVVTRTTAAVLLLASGKLEPKPEAEDV